jgi:predicted nucleic acid-binding protein
LYLPVLESEPGRELGAKVGSIRTVLVHPFAPETLDTEQPSFSGHPDQIGAGVLRLIKRVRRLKRSAYVEKVFELFPIYHFEISIARKYAELWSDLSRQGIQIGAHDLIIGSTALSLGFSVATYNLRHFERIEGLKIETLTLQQ